ncbi:hypothetical protein, conserved [Angomonas deanei]|uniref:Uncharacterized protein n=1 Tax=Angomonas deanei TaxID=59799 RepID=A0A7G2CDS4_9TRYP|nr:hypothetical protein, conserved [Angomonas deanei]
MSLVKTGDAIRALDAPRLLIAAAQPYQTIVGPALSTNFLYQPQLLPFQKLPFHSSHTGPVTSLYYYTLFSSLAEFAETPRPVRYSNVKQVSPPLEHFWREVGVLNTFYCTNYVPTKDSLREHPAVGAVELVKDSHRSNANVRMSLYSSEHVPCSSVLLTGPRDTKQEVYHSGEAPVPVKGLPPLDVPRTQEEFYTPLCISREEQITRLDLLGSPSKETTPYGGLYGPLVVLRNALGYAQRGCYRLEAAEGGAVVPPWLLYTAMTDFHSRLLEEGHIPLEVEKSTPWFLCAQQVVHAEDVVFDEPFDMVCAPPKYFQKYRLPPWRHQLGMPDLKGDRPCSCVRLEIRQRDLVVCSGTFFFCPLL